MGPQRGETVSSTAHHTHIAGAAEVAGEQKLTYLDVVQHDQRSVTGQDGLVSAWRAGGGARAGARTYPLTPDTVR